MDSSSGWFDFTANLISGGAYEVCPRNVPAVASPLVFLDSHRCNDFLFELAQPHEAYSLKSASQPRRIIFRDKSQSGEV
jgi:hypothetical protein